MGWVFSKVIFTFWPTLTVKALVSYSMPAAPAGLMVSSKVALAWAGAAGVALGAAWGAGAGAGVGASAAGAEAATAGAFSPKLCFSAPPRRTKPQKAANKATRAPKTRLSVDQMEPVSCGEEVVEADIEWGTIRRERSTGWQGRNCQLESLRRELFWPLQAASPTRRPICAFGDPFA